MNHAHIPPAPCTCGHRGICTTCIIAELDQATRPARDLYDAGIRALTRKPADLKVVKP